MKRIINDYNNYLDTIEELSKDKHLYISTYGLAIDNQIERILKKAFDFKLIVGIYDRYCFPDCKHCKLNIANNKLNILSYQKEFGNKRIIGIDNLHKKIVITNNTIIIGGFNLTASQFTDNALLIRSKDLYIQSLTLFEKQFKILHHTQLDVKGKKLVTFGKYRGQPFDIMHKDTRYVDYLHSIMDKRSFEEKIGIPY